MNMTTQTYQQLIIEGIKGLPPEILAEVVDFILFMRKRVMQPEAFEKELQNALFRLELKQLNHDEEAHLEKEFEDYDQLYPLE
jgi:hypothetical protein